MDDEETRSTSPSKLTARQRAKGNKDLQETLVSLPGKFSSSVLYSVPLLLRCLPFSLLVRVKVQGQAPQDEMSLLVLIPTAIPYIPIQQLDSHNTTLLVPSPARFTVHHDQTLEPTANIPEAGAKKALVLTEAERIQRREESARRRKRQMEQKLQDEQVCLCLCLFSFSFFKSTTTCPRPSFAASM